VHVASFVCLMSAVDCLCTAHRALFVNNVCLMSVVERHCTMHRAWCIIVMSLTASGAKVNVIDTKGCSPLHYAAAYDMDAK